MVGETWRGARLEWEDNRPLLAFGDGPRRSERLGPVFSRHEMSGMKVKVTGLGERGVEAWRGWASPNSQNFSKRHNSQVLRTPKSGIKDDRPVGERELGTEDPGP
ncbi:hypothetical protein PCH_Pc12g07560 [Penicillium rubens Wisconsin 54-1255]|uniref:Uncharacterized protein n=1 Tax=Penicillium rubens (strain ATCC 28089 / DSM 1075 / NRRL 1951 / Wisconsin 54-1255) TaxID=500485 RepID=B6GX28_PENRW|nr:hypothetical protein PCH_Pc12g07560 [Penicillium rubens Wisconsin 54-1255]